MIRKFTDEDMGFLQEQDFVASLELQYHNDVIKDTAVTAVDDGGECVGVMYLKEHFTYGGARADLNRIVPCIFTEDDNVFAELLSEAKRYCDGQAAEHPDKRAALAAWVDDDEHDRQQLFMRGGFMAYAVCPCLGYDLTDEVSVPVLPDGITVRALEFTPEEVERYIQMTAEANDGDRDSANEVWFTQGSGTYSIFVLEDGDRLVSCASMWKITDERAAIENIMCVPDYRRRGLARAVILHTLSEIRAAGYKLATLGMQGRNLPAMKLYESLGFELNYNQIEMIYLPEARKD